MDIRKKYLQETGKLYYKEASLEFEWDDDYVEWLEKKSGTSIKFRWC